MCNCHHWSVDRIVTVTNREWLLESVLFLEFVVSDLRANRTISENTDLIFDIRSVDDRTLKCTMFEKRQSATGYLQAAYTKWSHYENQPLLIQGSLDYLKRANVGLNPLPVDLKHCSFHVTPTQFTPLHVPQFTPLHVTPIHSTPCHPN